MSMQAWNTSTLLNVGITEKTMARVELYICAAIRWTGPCFKRQTFSDGYGAFPSV